MADPLCQRFFTEPTQTRHKHYEILRAHFVEQRPLPAIAEQFGMNFYSVRALVRAFRAQCQADQVPPFLSNRGAVAPPSLLFREPCRRPSCRPWPTVVSSVWPPADTCAPAWPASSSSCRCWPGSVSMPWSTKPVIRVRA